MISFKGIHYPKDIILHAVFYVIGRPFLIAILNKFWRQRELKLIMLNRWV